MRTQNDLHFYQQYSARFIEEHPVSAIFLTCGMGKTIITLTALNDLLFDSFEAHRVLVIAPLRVASLSWPDEFCKWTHLSALAYSVAVGTETERRAALMKPADIYIINRENVQWLIEESRLPFDYDTVVVDELSSFKNHQSKRFRALMKVRPTVKRIIGLTGTPSSNGLMDLWAEFRLLDMGQRLGRFIGQYRERYFIPDKRNGQVIFSYKPLPGAEQRIYDKISDITISMRSADHLKMPELISSEYAVHLSDDERERYDEWTGNKKVNKKNRDRLRWNKICRRAIIEVGMKPEIVKPMNIVGKINTQLFNVSKGFTLDELSFNGLEGGLRDGVVIWTALHTQRTDNTKIM